MSKGEKRDEMTVSLDGMSLAGALSGLLAIPDPEATKPKHKKAKRGKAPHTGKG